MKYTREEQEKRDLEEMLRPDDPNRDDDYYLLRPEDQDK